MQQLWKLELPATQSAKAPAPLRLVESCILAVWSPSGVCLSHCPPLCSSSPLPCHKQNNKQTVTTAVRDAVHRASQGVSVAGNAAAEAAGSVADKAREAVKVCGVCSLHTVWCEGGLWCVALKRAQRICVRACVNASLARDQTSQPLWTRGLDGERLRMCIQPSAAACNARQDCALPR